MTSENKTLLIRNSYLKHKKLLSYYVLLPVNGIQLYCIDTTVLTFCSILVVKLLKAWFVLLSRAGTQGTCNSMVTFTEITRINQNVHYKTT